MEDVETVSYTHLKAKVQQKMCEIAKQLKEELQNNNIDAMGELLHKNWILKKSLASGISNPLIDDVYERAMKAGATGGKLLGACLLYTSRCV